MRYRVAKSSIATLAAVAAVAGVAFAQDNHDRYQSDRPTHSETQQRDHNSDRQDQTGQSADMNRSHEEASRNKERDSRDHRVASSDDKDMADRYRREHPHSAARCHDGFFTRTTDRNLACSKHGGIDMWLMQ